MEGMTFALAFSSLPANAPRQRVRCAATGRFVAWAKVPQLRAAGAARIVVIPSPLVVVVADAAPPVVESATVAVAAGAEALSADAPPVVVNASLNGALAVGTTLLAGARSLVGRAARWAIPRSPQWLVRVRWPRLPPRSGGGACDGDGDTSPLGDVHYHRLDRAVGGGLFCECGAGMGVLGRPQGLDGGAAAARLGRKIFPPVELSN